MGSKPAWDKDDWDAYAKTSTTARSSASYAGVYTSSHSRTVDDYLNPAKVHMRESRNSVTNPVTTPVMVGIDLTGSMGSIAHSIIKDGLGVFAKEAFDRKVVPGPHLLFAGINDVIHDPIPLQVTQFESDIKVLEQLLKFAGFGGGGGNSWESYNLLWHFAAYHTSADAFEKDARKGYLFTVGDEEVPPDLTSDQLLKVYGDRQEIACSNVALLERLSMMYNVYHIVVAQGSHVRLHGVDRVLRPWSDLMGQNVLVLEKSELLSELIISTMQVNEGASVADVAKSWSGETGLVIAKALSGGLATTTSAATGVTRF